jgi:hypothetical protein
MYVSYHTLACVGCSDFIIVMLICICISIARRPELLETLYMTYVSAPQYQRQCIHEQLPELVRTIGMNNEALLTSLRQCVRGSEPCVLHILNILTKNEAASLQLTDVVHYLYRSRQVRTYYTLSFHINDLL